MRGTEKQIKWAEDIKARTLRTINIFKEHVSEEAPPAEKLAEVNSMLDEVIDNINSCENAWNIINVYQNLRDGNVGDLLASWRCAYPMMDRKNEEKLIPRTFRRINNGIIRKDR